MAQRLEVVKSLSVPRQQLVRLIIPAALGLCILGAFWPGLRSGFHSDDFVLITEAQLNHFDLALFKVDPAWWFYRPFSKLVWLCMYHLWGLNSAPYHLASLGLHWLNTLLVVALVTQITGRPANALSAGLLFALLPFHVEAVVWLASQYDLLATCGYLATLLCLLLFWRRRRIWLYLLSLLAYQLSLWSKELAFTLPMMVVVLWLVVCERPRVRLLGISLLPYMALLCMNLLQRYFVWGSIGGYATASSDYLSYAWDHLAGTLALMLGPLHRMIFPASVVQIWMIGISAVVIAGLMAGLNQRMVLLSFAWLGLTLLPALNIMPPGFDLQNTRQLYLPGVGLSIGLVALIDATVKRFVAGRRSVFISSIGVMSLLYISILWIHIQPWVVAGREAIHVVEELHRFIPSFPIGSRLQVAGLPDNYQGAYIFRLGLDHAYGQRYHSLFELEPVQKLPPLATRGNRPDAIFQVVFSFDSAGRRWEISRVRGLVEQDQPEVALSPSQSWDFGTCASAADWVREQARGSCEQGRGLVLTPLNSVVHMRSPSLQFPVGWTEVLLDMEADKDAGADATMRIRWSTTTSDRASDRFVEVNLLAGRHGYIVFLPPDAARNPIDHVSLLEEGLDSEVLVKRIAIRPIP